MLPEDVTAESIVSLDDDVIVITPEITERDIIEDLSTSQQPEIEEEENDDKDENPIDESFDQSQAKPSRSEVESALNVFKDAALYSDKRNEMQNIIFKFEKLFCAERLNSLKQKDITDFFKAT